MDLSPLYISLKTALLSTTLVFFVGIFAAHIVNKTKYAKGILDGILTLPMILPPTVVGFFLLQIFGINGIVGKPFIELFKTKIIFSWSAAVIASAVVSLPLMYRTVRGSFEQMDKNLVFSAQTLGLSNTYIFWRIVVPNCKGGIAAGTVLAFARGLGEFGATIMLAGNIPGKTQTISIAVYSAMSSGNDELAYKWVFVNLIISFASMLMLNAFLRVKKN